jgi:hypothetical protein
MRGQAMIARRGFPDGGNCVQQDERHEKRRLVLVVGAFARSFRIQIERTCSGLTTQWEVPQLEGLGASDETHRV